MLCFLKVWLSLKRRRRKWMLLAGHCQPLKRKQLLRHVTACWWVNIVMHWWRRRFKEVPGLRLIWMLTRSLPTWPVSIPLSRCTRMTMWTRVSQRMILIPQPGKWLLCKLYRHCSKPWPFWSNRCWSKRKSLRTWLKSAARNCRMQCRLHLVIVFMRMPVCSSATKNGWRERRKIYARSI